MTVTIKPGWKAGTKVRFDGLGTELRNGPAADVVCESSPALLGGPSVASASLLTFPLSLSSSFPVVIEEKPHPIYTRADMDLSISLPLTLLEALTNDGNLKRTVTLLDGTTVAVPVPRAVVQPGKETRIPERGMPISKASSVKRRGDLVVKWTVTLPEKLSDEKRQALEKLLA